MSASLADYVADRAGDSLRVFARYDPEAVSLAYCREDVDREGARELLAAVHERLTWEWHPEDDALDRLGDVRASVQVHEDQVMVNLPTGEDRGALVCLDLDAARSLDRFVTGCTRHLNREKAQPSGGPRDAHGGRTVERRRR